MQYSTVNAVFNFIDQEQGWTQNNEMLDLLLFCKNKWHLIQKGNIKVSESIITATVNIGQNTHFNQMTHNRHN